MWIDVIRYEPYTLSLRPFKFFFQLLHWFLQLQSYFIKWYEKEQNRKQTLESVQYGLEIIFNLDVGRRILHRSIDIDAFITEWQVL